MYAPAAILHPIAVRALPRVLFSSPAGVWHERGRSRACRPAAQRSRRAAKAQPVARCGGRRGGMAQGRTPPSGLNVSGAGGRQDESQAAAGAKGASAWPLSCLRPAAAPLQPAALPAPRLQASSRRPLPGSAQSRACPLAATGACWRWAARTAASRCGSGPTCGGGSGGPARPAGVAPPAGD